MLGVAATAIAFGLLPKFAVAQTSKATCLSGFQWSYNSDNVNPCDIAASLAGVCVGGAFTLAPLDTGFVYLGPIAANANACRCSSVYYSLLSACANCQDRDWIRWSAYNANCTTVYSQVYNQPIPISMKVPAYAYQDVQTSDDFNVTLAQSTKGTESTRPPTSASSASASKSPTRSGASSPSSSTKSKSHTGAIAGGVVAGIVALIIIALLVVWLVKRNGNKKNTKPTSVSTYEPVQQTPQMGYVAHAPSSYTMSPAPTNLSHPNTTSPPPGALYNPNDPTTFPIPEHTTGGAASFTSYPQPGTPDPLMQHQYSQGGLSQNFTGSTQAGPGRAHYTGAPEV